MKNINQVIKYSKKVKPLLNLSHWSVCYIWDVGGKKEGIPMSNFRQFNYKTANIYVYEPFLQMFQEEQEILIIHELMHCHMGFWDRPLEGVKSTKIMSEIQQVTLHNTITDNEEESVELLARAIHKLISNK